MLQTQAGERLMTDCATELFDSMQAVAQLLDTANESTQYSESLQQQQAKVADPELTPSARILREMKEKDLPFFRLAMAYSERWADHFRDRELSAETLRAFEEETRRSLAAQREIEQADDVSFSQYLDQYFAQYRQL